MRKLLLPLVVVLVAVLLSSMFTVQEGQRSFVIRFGKILKNDQNQDVLYEPGLHFKLPFIDTVRTMDARIQTMDDQADRFVTVEKKDVIIDSYVKWKIENFGKFYLATGGNFAQAQRILMVKLSNSLRAQIGGLTIKEIVSEKREQVMQNVLDGIDPSGLTPEEKETMLKANPDAFKGLRQSALDDLGIRVVDLRVKRINLPDQINESIYKRMRAERQSVAAFHRATGKKLAEEITAAADLEVATIMAKADRDARTIRGQADATAAEIYANAYTQDTDFFEFLRSLQAYEASFNNKSDVLVLDGETDFFRYMKDSQGK
ncbi:Modulator of FtsH protease HflC [Vibrio stylophorae]|uniref:Protein HflC n=1 Tax=Vibrio stylophorae TaxID=659351 RepID=A0ABN8DXP8_9VIBR|nr:protease modulator HflC [Vibrio stylophorae]CAH0534610.1 Modulator of FtsH protease HflC [Vibrio stylophorae]